LANVDDILFHEPKLCFCFNMQTDHDQKECEMCTVNIITGS